MVKKHFLILAVNCALFLSLDRSLFAQGGYTAADMQSRSPNDPMNYDPRAFFKSRGYMMMQDGHTPCQAEGEGDHSATSNSFAPKFDPTLNEFKNRDVQPDSFVVLDLDSLIRSEPSNKIVFEKDVLEADWPANVRKEMNSFQQLGVTVEGFFAYSKPEENESCNCEDTTHTDYHTWFSVKPLADTTSGRTMKNPKEAKSISLVAEVSPFMLGADHKSDHPKWDSASINRVARLRLPVRLSGWLTWDHAHPEMLKPASGQPFALRATLWEIHPIHRIEVKKNKGKWVDLDNF